MFKWCFLVNILKSLYQKYILSFLCIVVHGLAQLGDQVVAVAGNSKKTVKEKMYKDLYDLAFQDKIKFCLKDEGVVVGGCLCLKRITPLSR